MNHLITNFFRTLFLVLAMAYSSKAMSFSGGAIAGGGGDSVTRGGEEIFRDFIPTEQPTAMEDNSEFLNQVPGFRTFVRRMAHISPMFAVRVVDDLLGVRIYQSERELPILPYSMTTVSGEAADRQHAYRFGDDMVIGPGFADSTRAEYRLLHESLQGLLLNNFGPFHHVRVRRIVNYIRKNIRDLNEEMLVEVLRKNMYRYLNDFSDEKANSFAEFLWDKKNDSRARCFFSMTLWVHNIAEFERIECLETNELVTGLRNKDVLSFIQEKFPERLAVYRRDYQYRSDHLKKVPLVSSYELEKLGFFEMSRHRFQKDICISNDSDMESLQKYIGAVQEKANFVSRMIDLLESSSLTEGEKKLVRVSMPVEVGESKSYEAGLSELQQRLLRARQNLKRAQQLHESCLKMYSDLFE